MSTFAVGRGFERRFNPAPVMVVGWLAAGLALVLGLVPLELYLALVAVGLLLTVAALVIRNAPRWAGLEYSTLLVAAVMVPLPLPGGLNVPLLVAIFACAWWLTQQFLRRRISVDRSSVTTATLAFIGVALLSFIVGQYPWFPAPGAPMRAQLGGLALFVVSGGVLLAVGHQIKDLLQLERLTWLFVIVGGAFAVQQALPANPVSSMMDRITSPDTVGSMFWVWIVAISYSQALFNDDLSPLKRGAMALVGTAAIYRGLVVAFSWASGWLPPLVALGVLLLVRFPRLTVAGAALGAAPALIVSGMAIDKVMGGESYSWMTRVEALSVVFEMMKTNPLFGFGPANYYHYTLLFPILGWWVRFNSHNNYIDIVAQTGVIGLVVFGWLSLSLGVMALRVRRRALDGFSKAYMMGALAGLAASLVAAALADWIVPFAYNIGTRGFRSSVLFWIFMGGVLAIKRLTDEPRFGVVGSRDTDPVRLQPHGFQHT